MPQGGYGSGTMREARPGVWRLRAYVGRDPATGKPLQAHKTFQGSETAARRELARLVTECREGRAAGSRSTVTQLLDAWLAHIESTRRETTITGYRRKVEKTIKPAVGAIRLDRLGADDLDRFYRALLAQGLSTTTVRQYHAIISAALRQAERWGWVESSSARRASPPTARRPEMRVPTPDELQSIVRDCQADDPMLASAIALAALTGCRRGELCALRWSDFDLETGMVTIARSVYHAGGSLREGPTKTHQSRRVALDDVALAVVRHRLAQQQRLAAEADARLVPDPYLLSFRADAATPVSPDTITHRFRVVAGGRFRFHDLRHFSVTTLIAAGVDVRTVSERVGHRQATMTLDRYAHALPERDRAAAGVLGRALGSGR